jgi:Dyp-type peroxidase family
MSGHTLRLDNIQANVIRGSSKWIRAAYLFLRMDGRKRAAKFIEGLLDDPCFGTAESVFPDRPNANINIAFSHHGVEKMKLVIDDASRYEREFLLRPIHHEKGNAAGDHGPPGSAFEGGMRSANLGDTWPAKRGTSYKWPNGDPAHAWWTDDADRQSWKGADKWPHLLVWVSATSDGTRDAVLKRIRKLLVTTGGVTEVGCQHAAAFPGFQEHFGFVDGISQPAIEGVRPGKPGDGKLGARGWQSLPVGEFILGHSDEGYGPPGRLDVAPDALDGTFLVYRKLRQDVDAFRKASLKMAKDSDLTGSEIQEKIMGRHKDGTPLVVPPGASDPPESPDLWNDFTYSNDPDGGRCPFGSHARRANPRDDLHFEGRRVNRHRIIRRAMTYGSRFNPDDSDDDGKRGLIFIAFNSRIEDQFEFIQRQWLNGGRTFRLGDDADLIAGNGKNVRIVINGETPILHCQPKPFTQFLGGDYFFVPSVTTLRKIASGRAGVPPAAGQ